MTSRPSRQIVIRDLAPAAVILRVVKRLPLLRGEAAWARATSTDARNDPPPSRPARFIATDRQRTQHMHARWIVPAVLAMLMGITACSRGDDPPTPAQRAEITRQVKQTFMDMTAATEHMDPGLFTKYCKDNPGFLYVSPYGEAFNYAQSQKFWNGLVYSFTSQKYQLTRVKVIILSRTTALLYWQGNVSGTARDGDVFTSGPYSGTNVFRKFGSKWKVVYIQESGAPPKKSKAPTAIADNG